MVGIAFETFALKVNGWVGGPVGAGDNVTLADIVAQRMGYQAEALLGDADIASGLNPIEAAVVVNAVRFDADPLVFVNRIAYGREEAFVGGVRDGLICAELGLGSSRLRPDLRAGAAAEK